MSLKSLEDLHSYWPKYC